LVKLPIPEDILTRESTAFLTKTIPMGKDSENLLSSLIENPANSLNENLPPSLSEKTMTSPSENVPSENAEVAWL
jgi:hypothetical protein